MLPERPDINEYMGYTNDLAEAKTALAEYEYALDKKIATCIRNAMNAGAKTRALDYIKVIGNSEADTKEMEAYRTEINALRQTISILYGRIKSWEAKKDLFRTDSFFQVRGTNYMDEKKEDEGEN